MKTLKNILLSTLLIIGIISCSKDDPVNVDDNNNNNNNDSLLKSFNYDFKDLNNIVFEEYAIDSLSNILTDTKKIGKLEKLKIERIAELNNISGIFFNKTYSNDNPNIYKQNYAYDSTRVFVEADVINSIVNFMLPGGFDSIFLLPKNYYKIADNNLNVWNATTISIDRVTEEPSGTTKSVKGKLSFDMLKNGNLKDYNYKDKKIKVQEFVGTMNFQGKVSLTGDLEHNISVKIHFIVNDKNAIMKIWIPFSSIPLIGAEIKINGYVFEIK